ncbi:FAD-binding oxidoreductase [Thioalkalivibrio paradoxus]|uniref:FAD-linked oxidase n=1 Tax=Thioalkalivibrio paradoxus ARh 1 TaxID=713585 RepID=W0DLG8_9GAMM|nr:FAD-binding oxidoreductase [Thioalkalivibrio paradoxus]AHE97710.1 FAD-linked oxidase [Thioalkalivibrio paradoxus ARh 1]
MPSSWNRLPRVRHARVLEWTDRSAPLPASAAPLLARGSGRSHGDACLNDRGTLLLTGDMDQLIAFDRRTGVLECEAGMQVGDLLAWSLPQGWALPVVPATQSVTLGGAVANDVHGRNHPIAGSFGRHVIGLELRRSDGARLWIGPKQQRELFAATVGGLGLTGLMTRIRLQLMPVCNAFMLAERHRFPHLDAFWELNDRLGADWPYRVAWIDCLAHGSKLGRGVFLGSRHAPPQPASARLPRGRHRSAAMRFDLPGWILHRHSVRVFNQLYFQLGARPGLQLQHYRPHFFPLDGLRDWNRIYGRRGFYRYQCVLPPGAARDGIRTLLRRIAANRQGACRATLQCFGTLPSPGLLSFPRPGVTLALDFTNQGHRTRSLFADLDDVVSAAGGALYPGQDARMSVTVFRRGFPNWEQFATFIDPAFSSSFWRRMNP